MKAVSTIIASIMLMIIVIGLVSTAYIFITRIYGGQTSKTIKLVKAKAHTVIVQNLGEDTIASDEIKVVVNGEQVEIANPQVIESLDTAFLKFIPPEPEMIAAKVNVIGPSNSLTSFVNIVPRESRATTTETMALWHFNSVNATNHTFDETGYDNDGFFNTNGEDINSKRVHGKFGYALEFDGDNDYVEIPTSQSLNFSSTCQFTQAAWIYPKHPPHDPAGPTKWHGFLGYEPPPPGSGHTVNRTPSLWICNNTKIHMGFGNVTAWLNAVTDDIITNNAWNHVAVTFDGTYYRVYVNGVKRYENDTAWIPPAHGGVEVPWKGHCPNPYYARFDVGRVDNYFNGTIDEVTISNRSLTQEEILDIMYG